MASELAAEAAKADRSVNEAIAPSQPKEEAISVQPTNYSFQIDWRSPQGRRYHGQFKARIMTVKDTIAIGIIRAGLSGGIPSESLDRGTQDMTEMVATLQVCLEDSPEWAKDLVGLQDTDLIWEIYKEVRLREARFRGTSAGEGEGAAGS